VRYELPLCCVLFFIVRGSSRYEKLFWGFLVGTNFGKRRHVSAHDGYYVYVRNACIAREANL
jgi:hypothetical protein